MESVVRNFTYEYNHFGRDEGRKSLSYEITIPYLDNVNELSHRIVASEMDSMMNFLDEHNRLLPCLKRFITEENQKFYDEKDEELVRQRLEDPASMDSAINQLEKMYKDEVIEYAERVGPGDDEIFAHSFHNLVHSSFLPEIINTERVLASKITKMIHDMETEIRELTEKQQIEMDFKLQQLDHTLTSEHINQLLSSHYEAQNQLRKKWQSELEATRGHQKYEYRNWITTEVGNQSNISTVSTPVGNKSSMFVSPLPTLEESFTIHLGSQLKHMHNIRILCANIAELCGPLHAGENVNMSLGLYSSSLCGVVVLVPAGTLRPHKDIMKNANMSTEFHFDQIDYQIENLVNDIKQNGSVEQQEKNKKLKFKAGDYFITRHSNLCQAHVVFHLFYDETIHSGDINSRHPVIMGLRNIMKTASNYDVTSLTIPALLKLEMSEDMTVSWCVKRAELVFKCCKGFMIESASWCGAELSTLQLILPADMSVDLFSTLSSMVPNVFRLANPKILDARNVGLSS